MTEMDTSRSAHVLQSYYALLRAKARRARGTGIRPRGPLNSAMFDYQADVTDFLLRGGCAAGFLDTGMGKALIGLEWGRHIAETTNRPVLLLAPLAVGPQHAREAARFGIAARYLRDPTEARPGEIAITNYERLHRCDPSAFGGLVCDESSIVKAFGGKTSLALTAFADRVPYVLALTATPAPNDHMELGQHSRLLRIMDSNEMLARWFVADQSQMGRYRLKRHGESDFWSWMASWSRMATRPSDLGYSDEGFERPGHRTTLHYVDAALDEGADPGALFRTVDTSATSIHREKRRTAPARAARVAELVHAEPQEHWVIWCDTDYEADELIEVLPDATEVRGSQSMEVKESRLEAFLTGQVRHIIMKPEIGGFGLNMQFCARTAFCGLSFSYERFYQAVRRFDRYGQQRLVEVHIVMADTEAIIWNTIQRKAADHARMKSAMVAAMRREMIESEVKTSYRPTQTARIPQWLAA